jgi:ribosomal protein S20
MVSKIRGFIKDAREAAHAGDWTRASSLAKKAQVLSEELVGLH